MLHEAAVIIRPQILEQISILTVIFVLYCFVFIINLHCLKVAYRYSLSQLLQFHIGMKLHFRRISHGIPVSQGEIPFQVLLQYTRCWRTFTCGGALVHDRRGNQWVVTAAHCVNKRGKYIDPDIRKFQVRGGSVWDRGDYPNAKTRNVPNDERHIVFHPDWNINRYPTCYGTCFDTVPDYCNDCACGGSTWSGKTFDTICGF